MVRMEASRKAAKWRKDLGFMEHSSVAKAESRPTDHFGRAALKKVCIKKSEAWLNEPREQGMARVQGIDPRQTSFPMRQVFKKVRKMVGRDLTPQKIAARVPRVFWMNALGEW